MTPIGTLYRRSLARVARRAIAYNADPCPRTHELLRQAVHATNRLAGLLAPHRPGGHR